jgi:hypothetical protein
LGPIEKITRKQLGMIVLLQKKVKLRAGIDANHKVIGFGKLDGIRAESEVKIKST